MNGLKPVNQESGVGSSGLAEPSEARFRSWMIAALLLLGPPLLFALYYAVMFTGLTNPDALDYAQLGRNVSSGRGFTTYILRPLAMPDGAAATRMPDVTHGPLYPFVLAVAFGALGARDSIAALVSGLFYILTIPVLYILGLRLFSRTVGLATAVVFTVNALMLEYAVSGMHISLYIFLGSALLLVMYGLAVRARQAKENPSAPVPKGALAMAGALTALLYLTDPMFVFIIPVILTAVVWLFARSRIKSAIWFLIPFMILAGPWMARNAVLTGNPALGLRGSELWMNTKGHYPGYSAYRLAPDQVETSVGLFKAVVEKVLLGAGRVLQQFPQVTASWILAFLLPSLLFRFTDESANVLRRIMMFCFAAIFFGTVVIGVQMPLFVSLIPAMLVFAVAYLLYLVQQAQLRRSSLALLGTLLAVAVAYPLVSDMTLRDKPHRIPDATRAAEMARITAPDEVSISDQPWIVAWYADRPSLWIPLQDETISTMRERFAGLRWLFLTEQSRAYSREWQYVYDNFRNWNVEFTTLNQAKKPTPSSLEISEGSLNLPLFKALSGFVSVPPPAERDSATVVAELPIKRTNAGGSPARPKRSARAG